MVDVIPLQVLVIVLSQKFGGPDFWKIGGPDFLEDWSIPINLSKKNQSHLEKMVLPVAEGIRYF